MNRGVEIDTEVADDINRSVIREQVEMGVAVRMACLDALVHQELVTTSRGKGDDGREHRLHQRQTARPSERDRHTQATMLVRNGAIADVGILVRQWRTGRLLDRRLRRPLPRAWTDRHDGDTG